MTEADRERFHLVATEELPSLVHAARRQLANAGAPTSDAEDLAHETVLRAIAIQRRPPATWRAWLFGILGNVVKEHVRRAAPLPLDILPLAVTQTGQRFTYASHKRFRT